MIALNPMLLGNAVSLLGASLMAAIGLLKKRRHILLAQCVQFFLMGIANLILGGITGALSSCVNIARNLFCLQRGLTRPAKLVFSLMLAALCLPANSAGLLGVLPVLSGLIYTWFLDLQDARKLKCVLIVAQLCWVAYDLAYHNYVSFVFDLLTILSNLIGILTLHSAGEAGAPPTRAG